MKPIQCTDEKIWQKVVQDRMKLEVSKNEDVIKAYQDYLYKYLKVKPEELKKVTR